MASSPPVGYMDATKFPPCSALRQRRWKAPRAFQVGSIRHLERSFDCISFVGLSFHSKHLTHPAAEGFEHHLTTLLTSLASSDLDANIVLGGSLYSMLRTC
jgi:hypothetical protein